MSNAEMRAAEVLPRADRERMAAYIREGYILARLALR